MKALEGVKISETSQDSFSIIKSVMAEKFSEHGQKASEWLRETSFQLGLYAAILFGAISITYVGSEMMIAVLSEKMTEMGNDVVRLQLPRKVETASLRRAFD